MTELDDFLTGTLARQIEAETAIHNGDLTLRMEMWSRKDPVTLSGRTPTDTPSPLSSLRGAPQDRVHSVGCALLHPLVRCA